MADIRQFTAAIASSIEEQQAATAEISNNVAAAAVGTRSVVAVLERLSGATGELRNSADTVLTASSAVEKAAASLRDSVDGFLRKVAM
jgi:methyl-accepting chemotaxis protein